MKVPMERGPLSRWVSEVLRGSGTTQPPPVPQGPVTGDADVQLSLWLIYELHYRGFEDASDDLEWDTRLIGLRRDIERRFETELRAATADATGAVPAGGDLGQHILALAESGDPPSLALFLQRHATLEQMRSYLRDRSLQQLKESDPHSFVLGRLDGPAKAALAELQYDEYGGGRPERLHATLYGDALEGAGLDRTYGAYIDQASALNLANANVMSMFALNRRLRGASMGHLAVFEATSSVPCRRIANGVARLGLPEVVAAYFHEHVEADAVHEHLAADGICAAMVAADPGLRDDVVFGAATCLRMDALLAAEALQRWTTQLQVAS